VGSEGPENFFRESSPLPANISPDQLPGNSKNAVNDSFWFGDTALLIYLALVTVIVHMLVGQRYGIHRDELATLDDARHLAWGYVAYPPVTPFFGRISLILFGPTLPGFRLFAALAQAVALVLTGLMAKEMGGGRGAQLVAAFARGAVLPRRRRTHAIRFLRLPLLGSCRLLHGAPARIRQSALVASSRSLDRFRHAVEIHDGSFCGWHCRRGSLHRRAALPAQQMALVWSRILHPDFPPQPTLAGAKPFHFAGLSKTYPRARRPARAEQRIFCPNN